jgi:hypothetical protein
LADVLDIDLGAAALAKLAGSAERFRPDEFQGVAPVKD